MKMKSDIIIFKNQEVELDVNIKDDTVWLNRNHIAKLFDRDVKTIGKHINNALQEELSSYSTVANFTTVQKKNNSVVAKFATTASDGKVYQVEHYSLDMILSVGYRVKSTQGVFFRAWANVILRNYFVNGYSFNHHLVALQERIDSRFTTLENCIEQHQEQIDFLIRREKPITEQVFSTGCVWDAYTYVSNLVRTATESVILIDPFVDERTLLLLDKRADNVSCTVHTRYSQQIELDFQKHNQQCTPICRVQLPRSVHDRYLIIDNEVWLLGASVKDMGRGLTTVIKLSFTPEEILSRV
ncbi:MAG: virulence RhuM family protein [Bacteroidaceae bacterium]|nr:virulence RhuM family protein [Bacteroidaceae bacterium]